jgi:3-dehydroquinate dehydratase / shikimate dehydrogenase
MSRSLLCETVTGQSMAELIAARDNATAGDLVELRLDGVTDIDVAAALSGRRRPVVTTCRPEWEGGRFTGSEEERHRILALALELGAEFVDVEWRTLHGGHHPDFTDIIRRDPRRIVLSSHDFEGVPADLDGRVRDMRASGARIIKVAVTARRLADTLPLAQIASGGDAVVVGMGDAGIPSRLLATRYGSLWTYAGNGVAPGQIPAARMVHEFRFPDVGPETRIFGVVSSNAMHSLSPVMHNAAFGAAGLDAVYIPLAAADFSDFLDFAAAMGMEGASVTIPFKRDALGAAAAVDDLTRQVGAANTLRRLGPPVERRGAEEAAAHDAERQEPTVRWEATNTDVAGFLDPLESTLGSIEGLRVAVLGAGGSARAVIVALLSRGAGVTVHARRPEQAHEVTASLGASIGGWPLPSGSWDVLVNCTPLGGATLRDESPVPSGSLTGRLVYDLTYGPGESALVREARKAGCATLDGLPMLIAQAERQFEWWTGQTPAPGMMRQAAYARLGISTASQTTETQRHGVHL